ncbi:MAG: hypothetical protein HON14_03255 [Rhodospirillaceae bacterium]|nr:hypothetical protein [Rhodospirillaceae bacterium]
MATRPSPAASIDPVNKFGLIAPMNMVTRQRLINWTLMVVVLVLCFAAMEWIFRASPLSDRLGWASVKSVAERVRQTPKKSTGTLRILGLGDSYTIYRDGQGKNYLRVMEKMANQASQAVEVVNLSRPGVDLGFYEGVARQYIDVLKPDLITVGLYLGNDIPSKVLPPLNKVGVGFDIGLKEGIKKRSRLLNYSFRLLKGYIPALRSGQYHHALAITQKKYHISDQTLAARLKKTDAEIIKLAESDAINPWDLVNGLIQPNRYRDLILQNPASSAGAHVDALFIMLKRLDEFAKKRGIPIVFITIPIRLQVSAADQKYFDRLGVKTGSDLIGETALQKKISGMMRANGLRHFDILPALMSAKRDLFIPLDTHLNNDGQVVAGRHLYQYLKK